MPYHYFLFSDKHTKKSAGIFNGNVKQAMMGSKQKWYDL